MDVLPRDVAGLVVLAEGDTELAAWPLLVDGPVDLGVIERLAGLQLAARRMGCSIVLRLACADLVALLDLTGLADTIRLEMGRQAEGGEEPVGVEEVVIPDDPVA